VQLLTTVGIKTAVSYAEKLNVGTPPSVPSLALGASDVTLESLTAAYGAFADGGIVRDPILIRRVEDADGNVLFQGASTSHRAISEESAFLMASMLQDVISSGTAYRARQMGFTLPAAGKTGTTNDYNDAWFVGFTPHLVTGVWVGFDQPKTIIANGYAADVAVPIWAAFMKRATKGDKPDWIEKPANVVGVNVCRISGKLPNTGCDSVQVVTKDGEVETRSMIYTDYFVRGRQPTTICPLHEAPSLFDRLAGIFGKGNNTAAIAVDGAALPTVPPTSTSGSTAKTKATVKADAKDTTERTQEEPKKKRGFWSRLFGGGGNDKDDDKGKDKKQDQKQQDDANSGRDRGDRR
jgi:penicillin-binding protein 1A